MPSASMQALILLGTLKTASDGSLASGEAEWLQSHASLLSALQDALEQEPTVRLAFIFGSQAKGTNQPDSDLDLVIDVAGDSDYGQIHRHLSSRLGLQVDLFLLSWLEPAYLAPMLEVARCVLDKDNWWSNLPSHKAAASAAILAAKEQAKLTSRIPWVDQTLDELFAMSREEYEAQAPPDGTWSGRQRPSRDLSAETETLRSL